MLASWIHKNVILAIESRFFMKTTIFFFCWIHHNITENINYQIYCNQLPKSSVFCSMLKIIEVLKVITENPLIIVSSGNASRTWRRIWEIKISWCKMGIEWTLFCFHQIEFQNCRYFQNSGLYYVLFLNEFFVIGFSLYAIPKSSCIWNVQIRSTFQSTFQ